jgi:hypothetical protein
MFLWTSRVLADWGIEVLMLLDGKTEYVMFLQVNKSSSILVSG